MTEESRNQLREMLIAKATQLADLRRFKAYLRKIGDFHKEHVAIVVEADHIPEDYTHISFNVFDPKRMAITIAMPERVADILSQTGLPL